MSEKSVSGHRVRRARTAEPNQLRLREVIPHNRVGDYETGRNEFVMRDKSKGAGRTVGNDCLCRFGVDNTCEML